MKKFAAALTLALTLGAAGCRSATEYGECHGLFDENLKDPKLQYEVSVRNASSSASSSARRCCGRS